MTPPTRQLAATLELPPDLAGAIADELVKRLEASGVLAAAALPDPWLDVDQAATYLACKPQRIYNLVSEGRLRRAREGSRALFRRSWLDELVDVDQDLDQPRAA